MVTGNEFGRRQPVDGLRGVFALLVVLYHLRIPWISQGYSGVDGFFVISGFVITSVIVNEVLGNGSLNYYKFYSRRIKRLLPASTLVLIVTAIAYKWIAAPLLVERNRLSFIAGTIYSENFYLIYLSKDYFAQNVNESPVMHYWSLAVEEQFYLIWPATVTLLLKISRNKLFKLVALFSVVSLILMRTLFENEVTISMKYFGTQYRIYQLLLGAILSLLVALGYPRKNIIIPKPEIPRIHRAVGSTLSIVGLIGIIMISTPLYTTNSTNVGLIATFCVTSTLVGLEYHPWSWVARILNFPISQWLGKHSYSIYLWHYPLIVIANLYGYCSSPTNFFGVMAMICMIFMFAQVTWVTLEGPIKHSSLLSDKYVVLCAILSTIITIIVLLVVLQTPPMAFPIDSDQSEIDYYDEPLQPTPSPHTPIITNSDHHLPLFQENNPLRSKDLIIVHGDSFAEEWDSVMVSLAKEHHFKLERHNKQGCPWIPLDTITLESRDPRYCTSQQDLVGMLDNSPKVIMLFMFSILERFVRPYNSSDPWLAPLDRGWIELIDKYAREATLPLRSTNVTVVFVLPHLVPDGSEAMAVCVSANPNNSSKCDLPAYLPPGGWELRQLLSQIASEGENFIAIDFDDFICANMICHAVEDNILQFSDKSHITPNYAKHVKRKLVNLLESYNIFY
jgi:peptidoglycan/LPS O-acetylase OafA/YrhL